MNNTSNSPGSSEEDIPYAQPADVGAASAVESPETATPFPQPPRVWTTFAASIMGIGLGVIASGVALPIAMVTIGGMDLKSLSESPDFAEILGKIISHPAGIWIIIVPGQVVFLLTSLFAAAVSPVPFAKRLWMQNGDCPKWTWIAFAIATPVIAFASGMFIQGMLKLLGWEPSAQMEMIGDLLTSQTGYGFLVLLLLVAVIPGIVEELLFRGYLQSRLLKRWSPATAIGVSAVIFAIAHLDPMHALGVLPLGLWLGFVAWKTDSVWPGILCHMYSNGIATTAAQLAGDTEELTLTHLAVVAPSIIAMVICIVWLRKNPQPIDVA